MAQEGPPTVELFVRSLQPEAAAERQARLVDRLHSLEAAGVLADVDVTVWGEQLPLDGPTAETAAVRTYREQLEAAESWAADAGADLDGVLETRVVDRVLGDLTYRATVLPLWLMVERVDGEITHVTPHEHATGTDTVPDRLDHLAASADSSSDATSGDRSALAD